MNICLLSQLALSYGTWRAYNIVQITAKMLCLSSDIYENVFLSTILTFTALFPLSQFFCHENVKRLRNKKFSQFHLVLMQVFLVLQKQKQRNFNFWKDILWIIKKSYFRWHNIANLLLLLSFYCYKIFSFFWFYT